jgi:hypothetical protein
MRAARPSAGARRTPGRRPEDKEPGDHLRDRRDLPRRDFALEPFERSHNHFRVMNSKIRLNTNGSPPELMLKRLLPRPGTGTHQQWSGLPSQPQPQPRLRFPRSRTPVDPATTGRRGPQQDADPTQATPGLKAASLSSASAVARPNPRPNSGSPRRSDRFAAARPWRSWSAAHRPRSPHRASRRAASSPHRALAVGPEQVVQLVEAGDGWLVAEGAVWSAAIVKLQPAGERGIALVA